MNNSEAQRKLILEGSIPRTVSKMAVPSVVMQLITLIYNTVDTYFIAQIDKSAAAAVGTVFAIQAVIQAVGFGFGMGVSSICSRKLGEANDEEACKYATSGITGAFAVALVIGILGRIFINPLLRIIGCTDTMLEYGKAYALVILLWAPFACVMFVLGNVFKSEGHMKFSMYGNLAGAVINVFLDPLLIFTLKMGTKGAAIATSIGQLATLLVFSTMFIRKKTVLKIKLRYISKDIKDYGLIVATGMPTVFRQGLASVATALLCKSASNYGDAAVAAATISNKCYMLIRNVVLGIGQGTQPVAGYNYGAKQYKRTKEAFSFAIKIGTALCIASAVLLYVFAGAIMWWFCKDYEVLEYGVRAVRYASLVVPVMAFSTFVNQEYQCLGFKRQATVLASCRQGICFVPAILLLPLVFKVDGVLMAQPVADLLTFFISIPFYILMVRKLLGKSNK